MDEGDQNGDGNITREEFLNSMNNITRNNVDSTKLKIVMDATQTMFEDICRDALAQNNRVAKAIPVVKKLLASLRSKRITKKKVEKKVKSKISKKLQR